MSITNLYDLKADRFELEVDWRRRIQAITAIVETRQGCVIALEPIGLPETHDDGVHTWKRGKIKVTPA